MGEPDHEAGGQPIDRRPNQAEAQDLFDVLGLLRPGVLGDEAHRRPGEAIHPGVEVAFDVAAGDRPVLQLDVPGVDRIEARLDEDVGK